MIMNGKKEVYFYFKMLHSISICSSTEHQVGLEKVVGSKTGGGGGE